MNKIIIIFLSLVSISFAQNKIFTDNDFVVLGGINSNKLNTVGASLTIEARTNLLENFFGKISVGFYKAYSEENYLVKTYEESVLDENKFFTKYYFVNEKSYDVIPISLGFQYMIFTEPISPYLLTEIAYNIIGTKILFDNVVRNGVYDSYEQIPAEYSIKHKEDIKNSSISFGVGIGTKINLVKSLALDCRYVYLIDNKIINTHQLQLGFSF